MLNVKNEFRILVGNKVILDWEPQLVTDAGLYCYINPSLSSPTYKVGIGIGIDPATPLDTEIDNLISQSLTKTSAKTEYKSASGKAIAIFSFDLPVVSERTEFNQIGMYVNNTLFSKLVYNSPLFLLPGEGAEIQYRVSLEASKIPTVVEEDFFSYKTLGATWSNTSEWSAVPKGLRLNQAYLSFNDFNERIDINIPSGGVESDSVVVHSTTATSVTYLASWGTSKGSGSYKTVWIRDSTGRAFQVGTETGKHIFKNDQNLYSCLITVNMERADGITL